MEPLQIGKINDERERQYELAREDRRKELQKCLSKTCGGWEMQYGFVRASLPNELVEDLVDAVLELDESK